MKKKALLWLTRDLRIQDNSLIEWASKNLCEVIVFAFEPLGPSSAQKEFYLRSAFELKAMFDQHNIPFFVLKGNPVSEIMKWLNRNPIDIVLTQDFFNCRDRFHLDHLKKLLGPDRIKTFFGQTLIDKDKLPFEISKMPLVFTEFRKLVETSDSFAKPVPSNLTSLSGFKPIIPDDAEIISKLDARNDIEFPFDLMPGESAAIKRMDEYFWDTQSILNYKETRNGMLVKNDSSKFSVGLGLGCLSVRTAYDELKHFESVHGANESTRWFIYELLWRDYFKFLALKIGDQLFALNGINKNQKTWSQDSKRFQTWCQGETGADFIDANMNELNQTGWMSNRGRQNVASYLAKTMNLEWTLGADYFERVLIDIDTESNWGNWLYVAGVGTDPRDRVFNFQRQAEMYDGDFSYRRTWLTSKKMENP